MFKFIQKNIEAWWLLWKVSINRIWVPVPQVVEQVDQDDQVPHLPSGIIAVSLAMLLSIQISLKGSGLGSGNVP